MEIKCLFCEVFNLGKSKSFIFGFAVGGLAAGLTVLLSTPKPGREVRYDIKNKWDEANIKLVDMKTSVQSVTESVNDFTKKSIPAIKTTTLEMKNIINTWKEDIGSNLQTISHKVKELKNDAKDFSASSN